jgi:hypothetical protein
LWLENLLLKKRSLESSCESWKRGKLALQTMLLTPHYLLSTHHRDKISISCRRLSSSDLFLTLCLYTQMVPFLILYPRLRVSRMRENSIANDGSCLLLRLTLPFLEFLTLSHYPRPTLFTFSAPRPCELLLSFDT